MRGISMSLKLSLKAQNVAKKLWFFKQVTNTGLSLKDLEKL